MTLSEKKLFIILLQKQNTHSSPSLFALSDTYKSLLTPQHLLHILYHTLPLYPPFLSQSLSLLSHGIWTMWNPFFGVDRLVAMSSNSKSKTSLAHLPTVTSVMKYWKDNPIMSSVECYAYTWIGEARCFTPLVATRPTSRSGRLAWVNLSTKSSWSMLGLLPLALQSSHCPVTKWDLWNLFRASFLYVLS